jgi:hypothetical protein
MGGWSASTSFWHEHKLTPLYVPRPPCNPLQMRLRRSAPSRGNKKGTPARPRAVTQGQWPHARSRCFQDFSPHSDPYVPVRPRPKPHGKEGVVGSSPDGGLHEWPAKRPLSRVLVANADTRGKAEGTLGNTLTPSKEVSAIRNGNSGRRSISAWAFDATCGRGRLGRRDDRQRSQATTSTAMAATAINAGGIDCQASCRTAE